MQGLNVTGGPLYWVAICLAIAVFLLVEGLLIRSAWRARVSGSREAPDSGGSPSSSRTTEVVWTLLPAVLLALLIAWSIRLH